MPFKFRWRWWFLLIPIPFLGAAIYDHHRLTQSWPYLVAVQEIQTNEEVISIVGEPISFGTVTSWKWGPTFANIAIPFSGPKDEGRAMVSAKRDASQDWHFDRISVTYKKADCILDIK